MSSVCVYLDVRPRAMKMLHGCSSVLRFCKSFQST